MVSLDIQALCQRFSDVQPEHIKALLNFRGDFSSSEINELVASLPSPPAGMEAKMPKIFSQIVVQSGFLGW